MLLLLLNQPAGGPPGPGGSTAGLDLEVVVGDVVGSARTRPGVYPNPADAPGWVVKAVNRRGTVLGLLPHANAKTVVRTLNEEDQITFTSPKYDPATLVLKPLEVEVQVYRNDDLKSWGVLLSDGASSNDGAVSFAARGVWWYYRRRYFGTAKRRNKIRNGDFESGPAAGAAGVAPPGWVVVGDTTVRHWTEATRPGGHGLPDPLEGSKAVSLSQDTAGENAYMRARFDFETTSTTGQRLTFAAWVFIAEWIGPAALNLGFYVARVEAGLVTEQVFVPIDADTPRGRWVRLETSLVVRPNRPGYLEARLYSPAGWVAWDATVSVLMESTSSGTEGQDQAALAAKIVRYGQVGAGKSPLSIGTDCLPTGVIRERAWQHANHEWLNTAVEELGAFPDGFDFDVVLTPRTRTFTTYHPAKSRDRGGIVLRFGAGGNLSHYQRGDDGASVSTSVIARAAGDGPDREEGVARNLGPLGGLVLESFVDAPPDLLIGELDDYAADELATVDDVIEVLEVTVLGTWRVVVDDVDYGALIDLLDTGDRVGVEIDDGYVQVDDEYRVVRISIDCPTDTMVLVLNRVPS